MRTITSQAIHRAALLLLVLICACDKAEPLTATKAQEIISEYQFRAEPSYAEVPQKVWWTPKAPKDEFDAQSVQTLIKLRDAGYLTFTETHSPDDTSATYIAKVTQKGFHIIGTAPSLRGPVFRGLICYKVYDGIRNFIRHPHETTVGQAELVWHYDRPTPLYELFDTKRNKPLRKPFASHVSFYFKDHAWHFDVMVKKTEASADALKGK